MLQLTTIFFLIAFSTLAGIHYLAMKTFLYWRISWFDMPMHVFGGIIVALGFYTLRDLRLFSDKLLRPLVVVALVFVVAVSWEFFELFAGVPIEDDYFIDTSTDLIFGIMGGFIGYIVGKNLRSLH